MTAPYGSSERPGGWVEGIGWVALLCDLAEGDHYNWSEHAAVRDAGTVLLRTPVIVTRWADGTVPSRPSPVEDGRPDTGPLRAAAAELLAEALRVNAVVCDRVLLLACGKVHDAIADTHPSPGTGDDGSGT